MSARRIVSLIILVVVTVALLFVFQRIVISPKNIDMAVTQQGEYLLLKGKMNSGIQTFRGYIYSIENEKVIVTIEGSNMPIYGKNFDIKVRVPEKGIKEVYLKGEKGELVLAWEAETVYIPTVPTPTFEPSEIKPIPTR